MLSSGVTIRMTTVRLPHTVNPHFLLGRVLSLRLRLNRKYSTTCCSVAKPVNKEKVIVISGPTGSGKSKLALELAKRLNGEIISADSVQVYRGLDVGSAKPTLNERKEVPHHLIDILHPSEDYSVGQFYEDARKATEDILDRGHVPIVVGGTGLYLRWFMYGKPDVPKASREIISEVWGELELLQRGGDWDSAVQLVVKAGDPSVQSLAANDWYRLRRRMEIIKSSGSPPSAFQVPYNSFKEQEETCVAESTESNSVADELHESKIAELDYEFSCFFLSTKRIDLYRSIDFRCEDMLIGTDGLLSEAKGLLDLGLLPNSNSATRAIGYRQAMQYLLQCKEQGGWSSPGDFSYFLSEFQKSSRNFAKRQMTWFRNEKIYHWLDASKPLDEVLGFICDSYHSETGDLKVPEYLSMGRDMSSRREIADMKVYRPRNRHFVGHEDCNEIIEWVRSIMLQPALSV